MTDPLAFFLTWHTYGTWLHGHEKGSVNGDHSEFGAPFLAASEELMAASEAALIHPPVTLDAPQRNAVQAAVIEVCAHRGWNLFVLHVRSTHVHAVVAASASPEKILNDFKAYATRQLRRQKLMSPQQRVWSAHGSTKYIWKSEQLVEVIDYAVNRQGSPLDPKPIHQSLPSEPGA